MRNLYTIINIVFKHKTLMHPWLNWIEHLTTDEKVRGSNPLGCTPLENITL